MAHIFLQTKINAPIEMCFNLSRSIDLHLESTSETDEQAIGGVTSGLIGLNETVTWKAKHLGVWQTLTSKITEYHYPEFFVDEMVTGAFKSMRHEHRFKTFENATLMEDNFSFQSPLGIIGLAVDKLFLASYLKGFLEKRNSVIKEYAEGGKWKNFLK
jgi:ligand-binding SRPBCC domain-containing protein